jgi:c(7)-type cytochrome triheme protein
VKQRAPNGWLGRCRGAQRRRLRAALLLAAIWIGVGGLTSLGGCTPEARYRVFSTIFDGVPPPGTPRKERRRRRVVQKEPPPPAPEDVSEEDLELAVQGAAPQPAPDFKTYADMFAALPKDMTGNVDWVAAAEQGLIRPQPGLDPEAIESPILPYDVHLDPGIPNFEVVFPHAVHTYWLRCDNCHPAIFQMKAGSNPITMEKIFKGEYCGECHGKVAFPPQTGCLRCHVKLGRG